MTYPTYSTSSLEQVIPRVCISSLVASRLLSWSSTVFFCIVQTQQLIKSAIDGAVAVDSEEVYNSVNLAMCTLTSKLLFESHPSCHTEKTSRS